MKKLLIALMLLLFAVPVMGATLTFTWTANTEPDLAGYLLYRNGQYVKTVQASETSCTSESVEGLSVYYLTAFDTSANESEPSDVATYIEASGTVDTTPPAKINFTLTVQ